VIDLNNEKMANGMPLIFVPGDVIVVDNCAFHHSNIVETLLPQMFAQCGVTLIYQPPYHPQLNTCEYCFSIIKEYLKKCDNEFTLRHTELAISDAIIDGITLQKSESIFKHCGYIQ
jgi:transposase